MPWQSLDKYLLSSPPVPEPQCRGSRSANQNESYPHLASWTKWTDFTYTNMRKHLDPYLSVEGDFSVPRLSREELKVANETRVNYIFTRWHCTIVNTAMEVIYDEQKKRSRSDESSGSTPQQVSLVTCWKLKSSEDIFFPDWGVPSRPDAMKLPNIAPGDSKFTDYLFTEINVRDEVPDKEEDDPDPIHDRTEAEVESDYLYGCLEQVCAYAKVAGTRYGYLITTNQAVFIRIKRIASLSSRSLMRTRSFLGGREVLDLGEDFTIPDRAPLVTPRSASATGPSVIVGRPMTQFTTPKKTSASVNKTPGSSWSELSPLAAPTPTPPATLKAEQHLNRLTRLSDASGLTPPATISPSCPSTIRKELFTDHLATPSPSAGKQRRAASSLRRNLARSSRNALQTQPVSSLATGNPVRVEQPPASSPASSDTTDLPLPNPSFTGDARWVDEDFSSRIHTSDLAYSEGTQRDFDLEGAEISIVPWGGRDDGMTVLHGLVLLLYLASQEHKIGSEYGSIGSDRGHDDYEDDDRTP